VIGKPKKKPGNAHGYAKSYVPIRNQTTVFLPKLLLNPLNFQTARGTLQYRRISFGNTHHHGTPYALRIIPLAGSGPGHPRPGPANGVASGTGDSSAAGGVIGIDYARAAGFLVRA
jgi:hypothetical protein